MIFTALGDSAVVAHLGEPNSSRTLDRVRRLAAALKGAEIDGFTDVVPAYATVTVFYDPARFRLGEEGPYEAACRAVSRCAAAEGVEARRLPRRPAGRRVVDIPVCYGGENGPDLEAIAERAKLSPEDVVALHSAADYPVQAVGFLPGFPYLAGLPEALATPRRGTPRARVPAGSVGIGGGQTGIYPIESPGGWHLIGRTPETLFNPRADPPSLLRVGDRVRFRPIPPEAFAPAAPSEPAGPPSFAGPGITLVRPGLLTTVQDLGRAGLRSEGVPLSGAADPFALRVANLLAGNPEDAAGLEVMLAGPELEFEEETVVAVAGADFEGAPAWRAIRIAAGQRLAFGECLRGCRAYIAVSGGIATEPVLGSRSTYLRGGFGGWEGRALRAGDRLPVGRPSGAPPRLGGIVSPGIRPGYSPAPTLRVVPGPQAPEFGPELFDATFAVGRQSDRMGLRLEGPELARKAGHELASSAVTPGTVQIPPDGRPIVLLADGQTIGGYPQAAVVAAVDLPLAAQLRPGDRVRFQAIDLAEADRLARARDRDLAFLRTGLGR
jgi:KipI family sensor histidine kinase inhibitor